MFEAPVRSLRVLIDVEMLELPAPVHAGEGQGPAREVFLLALDPTAGNQQENNKHLLSQALLSPAIGQAMLQSQTEQQNIYGHSWKEWKIISQPCCSIYKPFSRKRSENGEKCYCQAAVKSQFAGVAAQNFCWMILLQEWPLLYPAW